MEEVDFIKDMRLLAQDAGKIAMRLINDSQAGLKDDLSVITAADKEISILVRQRLDKYLQTGKHVLIDEESQDRGKYLDKGLLQNTPYIWAVDPIDGTRLYANRMPLFAISIGLIRELTPWLGIVYFPYLREMFFCNGRQAFFVKGAFSSSEEVFSIKPVDEEITDKSLFLLSDNFFRYFQWKYGDCRLLITACAAANLCWPTIGRGCGSLDRSFIWDFAGSWPILRYAGLGMRRLDTGKLLDTLDIDCFSTGPSPWRLKDYYLISSERNYSILKARITTSDNPQPDPF